MTLGTDGNIIEVRKAATQTTVEDGIAMQGQRSVGADGEARGGWPLHGVVKLKLVVGNDFARTFVLVGEDPIL